MKNEKIRRRQGVQAGCGTESWGHEGRGERWRKDKRRCWWRRTDAAGFKSRNQTWETFEENERKRVADIVINRLDWGRSFAFHFFFSMHCFSKVSPINIFGKYFNHRELVWSFAFLPVFCFSLPLNCMRLKKLRRLIHLSLFQPLSLCLSSLSSKTHGYDVIQVYECSRSESDVTGLVSEGSSLCPKCPQDHATKSVFLLLLDYRTPR